MNFWKIHGLGNDYIVMDNRNNQLSENEIPLLAKKICTRKFSVGADGLLLVYNSNKADVQMKIFNADGSEAEMCGNGIRCFAKYCYENNIVKGKKFSVETKAGVKQIWLYFDNNNVTSVKVDMGLPNWDPHVIPLNREKICLNEPIAIDGNQYKISCLSMGNPHCVIFVENLNNYSVTKIGPVIENNPLFPNRTNVGFVEVKNAHELYARVWERGVGETLACGTGACAAAVVANKLSEVKDEVIVHLLGGDLKIKLSDHLYMTGSVEKVFQGRLF